MQTRRGLNGRQGRAGATARGLCLVLVLLGCDSGSGPSAALEAQAQASSEAISAIEAVAAETEALEALAPDADDSTVDARIDAFAAAVARLQPAVDALNAAEAELPEPFYGDSPGVTQSALLGQVLALVGLAAFAVKLGEVSQNMLARRAARDAALGAEDFEAYEAAQREIAALGAQAAQELVNKAIPKPSDTVIGMIPLGQIAIDTRNAVQDVTVLWGTEGCARGGDDPTCQIGGGTQVETAPLQVPAGSLQIVVTAPGRAREVLDIDVEQDAISTLLVDLLEVADLGGGEGGGEFHCDVPPNPGSDGSMSQCYANRDRVALEMACGLASLPPESIVPGPCPAGPSCLIGTQRTVYYGFLDAVLEGVEMSCNNAESGSWDSGYSP